MPIYVSGSDANDKLNEVSNSVEAVFYQRGMGKETKYEGRTYCKIADFVQEEKGFKRFLMQAGSWLATILTLGIVLASKDVFYATEGKKYKAVYVDPKDQSATSSIMDRIRKIKYETIVNSSLYDRYKSNFKDIVSEAFHELYNSPLVSLLSNEKPPTIADGQENLLTLISFPNFVMYAQLKEIASHRTPPERVEEGSRYHTVLKARALYQSLGSTEKDILTKKILNSDSVDLKKEIEEQKKLIKKIDEQKNLTKEEREEQKNLINKEIETKNRIQELFNLIGTMSQPLLQGNSDLGIITKKAVETAISIIPALERWEEFDKQQAVKRAEAKR